MSCLMQTTPLIPMVPPVTLGLPTMPGPPKEQEKLMLEQQMKPLKAQLEAIKKRLEELK